MIRLRRMDALEYPQANQLVDDRDTGRIRIEHTPADGSEAIWIAIVLPNGFIIENGDADEEIKQATQQTPQTL